MQDTRNSSERLAAAKSGLQLMAEEANRVWQQLAQARQICDSQLMRAPIAKPVRPSSLGLLALAVGSAALGLVLGGKRRAREAQRAAFDATIAGQVSWAGRVERYEQAMKATVAEITAQQTVRLAVADVAYIRGVLVRARSEFDFHGGCVTTDRPDLPLAPDTSWTVDFSDARAAIDVAVGLLERAARTQKKKGDGQRLQDGTSRFKEELDRYRASMKSGE
ncbi:hypothetical protein [Delftia acidovorans]|uniref:hypothetical protein n=1 Tax=Delftia acidovorans TaxID=80866 RepID=UPI0033429A57